MQKVHSNQQGFGFLAVLLVVVVLGALTVVALRVTGAKNDVPADATTAKVAVPDTISSKADVSKASAALDAIDVDNGVNPDSLNKDLNSLL